MPSASSTGAQTWTRAKSSSDRRRLTMLFARQLRERIRRGRIRSTVRIWQRPRVKEGGRYRMEDGHVVVDSIERIRIKDITYDLARESGFASVEDLLQTARHGAG